MLTSPFSLLTCTDLTFPIPARFVKILFPLFHAEDAGDAENTEKRNKSGFQRSVEFSFFSCYISYMMTIEHFDRITQNPAVMGGKPCIRGMRVTVGMIVGQIGEGVSIDELLSDYPYLEWEDVMQSLRYAADIEN